MPTTKKKKQLRIRLSNSIANEIDNEQTMPCLQVSKGFDTAKLARAPLILQIVCTLRRPYWTSTKKWQPSCSTKYSFGTWTQFSCKSFAYQVSKKPFHLTYVSRVTIWPQFLRDFTIYYISQAASANAQIKRITSKNKQREREQTERERERERCFWQNGPVSLVTSSSLSSSDLMRSICGFIDLERTGWVWRTRTVAACMRVKDRSLVSWKSVS